METPSPRHPADRGAALVLVLVFGAGMLVVVAVLLSLATTGAKAQGTRHNRRSLQAVLQAGVADALNEINRHRTAGPFDPAGDGVGALLTGPDGKIGVPVRSASGRLLGRYRVTVETSPTGRLFLAVVAAWPDFEHMGDPKVDRRRLMSAARLELEVNGIASGGQPLEIAGDASGDKDDPADVKSFKVDPGASVEILAPSLLVPAVRIGDAAFRDAFKALLPRPGWTVLGSDPQNPGAPASDAAAVSGAPDSTGLSAASIAQLADGIDAFVAQRAPGAKDLAAALIAQGAVGIPEGGKVKLKSSDGQPASFVLPEGDYLVPGDLVLDGSVSLIGSGTLLVDKKKLEVEDGATLSWQGNVLVSGNASAELKIKKGATVTVAGVLAVEGAKKKAKLKIEEDSALSVNGAALVLADAQDVQAKAERGEVVLKAGARIDIDGLFLIVGQHVHFEMEGGAVLEVTGSLAFGVPGAADKGIHKFSVKGGAQLKLIHDQAVLDASIQTLRAFTDALFPAQLAPFSVQAVSYWEPAPAGLYAAQQAVIDAGGSVGIDD